MKQKDFSNYPNRISLEVELKSEPQYPNSAYIVFDFDVEAVFGTKGRIPVVMTIDGKKFQRNLARYAGEYMMVFNKELRDETGYRAGDRVQILLERDQEERRVQIPKISWMLCVRQEFYQLGRSKVIRTRRSTSIGFWMQKRMKPKSGGSIN
jgi:hypothetical protein